MAISSVSIIAVHTLFGHREHDWCTYTGKDSVNWLQDTLPKRIPGAAVYSYGYELPVTSNVRSIVGEADFPGYEGTGTFSALAIEWAALKLLQELDKTFGDDVSVLGYGKRLGLYKRQCAYPMTA